MKKLLKVNIYFVVMLLMIQLLPYQALANDELVKEDETYPEVTLFSEDEETPIPLFEDETEEIILTEIPHGTTVELIEEDGDYSSIRFTEEDTEELLEWMGVIHTTSIQKPESLQPVETDEMAQEDEEINTDTALEETEVIDNEAVEETEAIETEETAEETIEESVEVTVEESVEETEISQEETQTEEIPAEKEEAAVEEDTAEKPAIQARTFSMTAMSTPVVQSALEGFALKQPTAVYSSTGSNAKILKSYNQGHVLKFKNHNSNWFSATVYINGKATAGYIKAGDVSVISEGNRLNGFAAADKLNVYESTSRTSKTLKSYGYGHSLVFTTYSAEWFKATVYISGKAHTGYIHVKDISFAKPPAKEEAAEEQSLAEPIKGIATASRVHVYSDTSRNSTSLKSYTQGHILVYRPYNSTWHQATVYVNGKRHTGYIHMADVENSVPVQETLTGIAMKNNTAVYSTTRTSAGVLRSYRQGHVLKFKTFTTGWYEATVIINGKAITGYINKNDIEEITSQSVRVNGVGIKNPTRIYASASTGSQVLKSYSQYSGLSYRTFTASWFEATVYVNGQPKTGYIHKDDVMITNDKIIVLDAGHGGRDPGAVERALEEKDLNLSIALRAEKLLKNAGYTVIMTRSTDVFLTLDQRSQISNRANADLFVSIHANKFNGQAKGIETFWYSKYEALNSQRFANLLQNRLVANMGLSHRRVALGNYHVVRETRAPSALVEVGFLDHAGDYEKLRQEKYHQLAAQGIFEGIVQYFN